MALSSRTKFIWSKGRTRTRLGRIFRGFLGSEVGTRARWLFAALVLLLVAINGLNVLNSFVGRDFMTALERRSVPRFLRMALVYLGVFAMSTTADVFLRFTEETLALTWREWLSRWAVNRYLHPTVYQRLSAHHGADELANPDERISDDVRAFTGTTLSFAILLLNGSFTIVAFSGVLWSISPPLFAVTVLYATAGSMLAIARGRPLVKLNVAQLDREADFRAELIHVRENADALAVARREDRLLARLWCRIDRLVENFSRMIRVRRNLGFFTVGYNYLIQIIPALVVGPLFIAGTVEFGVVTQSAMAFAQLVGAFSIIITQFQNISTYAAVVTRLGVLDEGMEEVEHRPGLVTAIQEGVQEAAVEFDRLTLLSPSDGRVLVRDLRGVVGSGSKLLIRGSNEEAKGALFRATAGVWHSGSGRLLRPGNHRMLFVAERPYLPPGSLREVLTDATWEYRVSDERLMEVLGRVGLEALPGRAGGLGMERRWDNLLSLGEQQRLAIAHVLLSAPRFVFLERPGGALGAEGLGRMLELLTGAGIWPLVIGAGEEGLAGFTSLLELGQDGGWQWRPLPAAAA